MQSLGADCRRRHWAEKLGAGGATESADWKSQAASYGRLDSWRQVPVAEHDFSCCESLFGGELSW